MAYFYSILFYLGCGGAVLCMGAASSDRFRVLRKPLSATLMTLITLLWAFAPQSGRWVLSVWAPTSVTGGLLVLDQHPAIWWSVLAMGTAACGVLWADLSKREPALPLTGTLVLALFTVTWLGLTAGSLLMTLAVWTVFDIVWLVTRLVSSADGDRVIWAAAVTGLASLLLWTVSLFLFQEGVSGLWWLMRPSKPIFALLLVGSLMRIGFYPFQVVVAESAGRSRALALVGLLGPVMGIALLYRLVSLPGVVVLPTWVVAWGTLSTLWAGLRTLGLDGKDALVPAGQALLLGAVTGALALADADALVVSAGVWVIGMGLLSVAGRVDDRSIYLAWPAAVAVSFLLAPLSPLGRLYLRLFSPISWGWRITLMLGFALGSAALLRSAVVRVKGRLLPPDVRTGLGWIGGLLVMLGVLIWSGFRADGPVVEPVSTLLWAGSLAIAALLVYARRLTASIGQQLRPLLELLDLQWFYQAAWEGAENLLGAVRATAEVVEGSGSVLWSVLVLLLVVMVIGSR
ncbi:MAG: hypothetical protein ACP5HS_05640 [Anaerolineae bacterium]